MSEVRTRFAPSPTGFMHVGGIRTTLFSWLLARKHGGQFILRIEDTDRERLVPEAVQSIVEELNWLGLEIDEGPTREELHQAGLLWDGASSFGGSLGPYVQSLRLERYKEVVEHLIELGVAYRCDCTPELLEKERKAQVARKETPGYSGHCRSRNVPADVPHVVRLIIPTDRVYAFEDAIRGAITWESVPLRDTVILKTDQFPTYHLAVVVDDHDMHISHALRGEEWIASTPIHLLIYEALGWQRPAIGHLPNVLGDDGKKLSKRHGATSVGAFREAGYLPEALCNFLALIGWSPGDGDEREIFSLSELVEQFSLERVSTAGGVFNFDKLDWMNGSYIRGLTSDEFIRRAENYLEDVGVAFNPERFRPLAAIIQERTKRLDELPAAIEFLNEGPLERDFAALSKKKLKPEAIQQIICGVKDSLANLQEFSVASVETALKQYAEQSGHKVGHVFTTVRIAVTGKMSTPPLMESLEALGAELVLQRLAETSDLLQSGGSV